MEGRPPRRTVLSKTSTMAFVADRLSAFTRAPAAGAWRGVTRAGLAAGGWVLIVASPFIGAIPGPGGIPVFLLGTVLVLKNSPGSRRLFVRLQHRYPKLVMPVRRLLRKRDTAFPSWWPKALRLNRT